MESISRINYQMKLKESKNIKAVLTISLEGSVKLTSSEKGCILLLNDESNMMEVVEIYNLHMNSKNFKWKYEIYKDFTNEDYLVTDNLEDLKFSDKEFIKLNDLKNALIYPLKTINKEYGSLQVFNKKGQYTEEDVTTIKLFSPYILNTYIRSDKSINF